LYYFLPSAGGSAVCTRDHGRDGKSANSAAQQGVAGRSADGADHGRDWMGVARPRAGASWNLRSRSGEDGSWMGLSTWTRAHGPLVLGREES
jgi:hypothetical protein